MRRSALIVMMFMMYSFACIGGFAAESDATSVSATPGVPIEVPPNPANASEPAIVASPAEVITDKELSTYELTAIAVGMRMERARARAQMIASTPVDPGEFIDSRSERVVLEGMLRSHADTGDRAVAKNRLESARLDQKLMTSRGQIMGTRLSALEAQISRLRQEIDSSKEELAECGRLRAEREKRLARLEQSGDSILSQDLLQRKKQALSDLIGARKEYEEILNSIIVGAEERCRLLDAQMRSGQATVSMYNEFNEKISTVIRKLEESVKRMGVESAAKEAKDAAESARRDMEAVDKKLDDIDNELVSDKTASATSIAAKSELIARRDHLLSQKETLAEQIRYYELRGRSARDVAQFEEIEQHATAGAVSSGPVLAFGMKEWMPRLDLALTEYQNEKHLVEKRLELLLSTRQMLSQTAAEKPDPQKREEIKNKKQQLTQTQASLHALNEQKAMYDSLIKHAFSAKQAVQRAIESELERNLFARIRFRPRTAFARALWRDISGIPSAVSSRIAVVSGLMGFGLFAQLLLTIAIGLGAGWAITRLKGFQGQSIEPYSLLEWLKQSAYALATVAILIATAVQVEPLTPLIVVPAVIIVAILAKQFIDRVFLRRLPEKHILRNAFSWIVGILFLGAPAIFLLRWFDIYGEIAFLIGLACKIALVWPFITVIKGADAFYGLMQYHFELKPDSRLLRITVLAYKFIALLNLVCLLTALYGYENLALFVFRRNIEAFAIIMLVAIGKPVSERLSAILFDHERGVATSYVGTERAQFLLFIGKKAFRLLVYIIAAIAAAAFVGISTDSFAIRLVIDWLVGQSDWLVARIGRVAIIIIAIILVLKFVQTFGESIIEYVKNESRSSLTENERRASTLVQILNTSVRVILFCIGGIMILRELGMDITPLLTGAGIVGVAIGFGSQSLVKDFFAGFFILVENQFRVGDVIEIGGRSGVVERINLKTTVLRAVDGSVFIIPNGEINSVKNMTYTWSRAVLDIGVAYETDLDKALEILQAVGDQLASDPALAPDIWGRPEVLGVENLDNSAIILRMLVKTRPLTQWQVSRIFRKKIKEEFDRAGIEIPFPQQVVTLKADSEMVKLFQGLNKAKESRPIEIDRPAGGPEERG